MRRSASALGSEREREREDRARAREREVDAPLRAAYSSSVSSNLSTCESSVYWPASPRACGSFESTCERGRCKASAGRRRGGRAGRTRAHPDGHVLAEAIVVERLVVVVEEGEDVACGGG